MNEEDRYGPTVVDGFSDPFGIVSQEFEIEGSAETRKYVVLGGGGVETLIPPDKKLLARFSRKKLLKILRWYDEMVRQTHDTTISTLIELLPVDGTRRMNDLGLVVIGNIGTDLGDLQRLEYAAIWQQGSNPKSRVIEYVFNENRPADPNSQLPHSEG